MKNTTAKKYETKWGFKAPPRSLQTRKLPGVVLKKYRVKRYCKVNKNVANSLPLNACGVKNKLLTENVININNKEHQLTTASLIGQLEQTGKFNANISIKLSERKIFSSIGTRNKNYLRTLNTTQNRTSVFTKAKSRYNNLNICKNKNKITLAAAEVAAEAATEKNKNKRSIEIIFQQRADIDITTRQIKDRMLNEENKKNKINNINSDRNKTKQAKVFKTTINALKYHITVNNNYKNNNKNATKKVNKLLFISKINENPNLTVTTLRLFIQLKLLLFFMFSHATNLLKGNPLPPCGGSGRGIVSVPGKTISVCRRNWYMTAHNIAKMKRARQLLTHSFKRICFKNTSIALYMVIYAVTAILLPHSVVGDDGDTFFPINNGVETTTPEFDYASRGQKKFGDKCENTLECGFPGSICDPKKKSCQCTEDLPVTNHIDKCGKEAAVNESCFFNEQCEVKYFQTECRDQRCVCRFDMTPVWLKDGSVECKGRGDKKGPETYVDPAMIGVLIGMALMFIIICVVLRLFSQARWRENRTIFNTPNPRLMNVSLLRESKLLHGQERRGSRMSVRAPSRQPSMASLRPHSPNPSLGKTGSRSNSHGSNASATSLRSTRSNSVSPAGIVASNSSHHERKGSTYQPHQHQHSQQHKLQPLQQQEQQCPAQANIISNPVAETVTVEIIEPEK